jgi:hypothetical protein
MVNKSVSRWALVVGGAGDLAAFKEAVERQMGKFPRLLIPQL